jgi:hypothetical protein
MPIDQRFPSALTHSPASLANADVRNPTPAKAGAHGANGSRPAPGRRVGRGLSESSVVLLRRDLPVVGTGLGGHGSRC